MFWFNFLVYYKPFRLTVDFKEIINEIEVSKEMKDSIAKLVSFSH